MKKIEQLTKPIIYLPCTPSQWITPEVDYKTITRINVTKPGGMAGSNYMEYVEKVETIDSNRMQAFTRITGKDILLNTSYILTAENFLLITAKFYNENPNAYELGENTLHYLAEFDMLHTSDSGQITLVDRYGKTSTL